MHFVLRRRGEHRAHGRIGMRGEQRAATEHGVVEMGGDDEQAWAGFAHGRVRIRCVARWWDASARVTENTASTQLRLNWQELRARVACATHVPATACYRSACCLAHSALYGAQILGRIHIAQNSGVEDIDSRHALRHQQRLRAAVAVEREQCVAMLDAETDRMSALAAVKRRD